MRILSALLFFVIAGVIASSVACLALPSQVSAVTGVSTWTLYSLQPISTRISLIGVCLLALALYFALDSRQEQAGKARVFKSMVERMGIDSNAIEKEVTLTLRKMRGISVAEIEQRLDNAYILGGTLAQEVATAESDFPTKFQNFATRLQDLKREHTGIEGRVGKLQQERNALLEQINQFKISSEKTRKSIERLNLAEDGRTKISSLLDNIEEEISSATEELEQYQSVQARVVHAQISLEELKSQMPQKA